MKTKESTVPYAQDNSTGSRRSLFGVIIGRSRGSNASLELAHVAQSIGTDEMLGYTEQIDIEQLDSLLQACLDMRQGSDLSPEAVGYLSKVDPKEFCELLLGGVDTLGVVQEAAHIETIGRVMNAGVDVLNRYIKRPSGEKLGLLLGSMSAFEHIRHNSPHGLNAMQAQRYFHQAIHCDLRYLDGLEADNPHQGLVEEWHERREEVESCRCFMCESNQRIRKFDADGIVDEGDGIGVLVKRYIADESKPPVGRTSLGRPVWRLEADSQSHERDLLWYAMSNFDKTVIIDDDFENRLALSIAHDGDKSMVQRMRDILGDVGPEQRKLLTRALGVLEFGTDYGDVILGIAEAGEDDEVVEFLRSFLALRESFMGYSSLYEGYSQELVDQVAHAAIERSTELAYVARDLVQHGTLTASYMGRTVTMQGLGELSQYVSSLSNCIERITSLMQNGIVTLANSGRDTSYQQFRFMGADKKDSMLLYVRPYGGYRPDRQVEYGTANSVEASISMKIASQTGHMNALRVPEADELSIRLDREGRAPWEGFKGTAERDPAQENGMMSLDIGSVLSTPGTFGSIIALLISHGNDLRTRATGEETALNHNTNFDQATYGTAEGFADVARAMLRQAHAARALSRQKGFRDIIRKAAA